MKNQKEEETSEFNPVEGVELDIVGVQLDEVQGQMQKIKKVTFSCAKGDITYKPKKIVTTFEDGFKVNRQEESFRSDLHETIGTIARLTNERGHIKVLATFTIMKTTKLGVETTYRFVNSAKIFDNWKILIEDNPKPVKIESVV